MIPKLVAHRGYTKNYPENSLLGIGMALKAGACMVEFDLQMSADHEFIVLHDSDLERTAGVADTVFNLTAAELSNISVHQSERFSDEFLNTPVPTLTQVMKLVADYPDVIAFVEIKNNSLERWGLEYVMDRLQKVLKPYASQSVIIAYNFGALQYVKQQGFYPTGWVLDNFDETSHKKADQLNPEYLICNQRKIPDKIEPWPGDWSWMLYDISDPELALQWARRGIELIETSDIGAMLKHPELSKESCYREL